MDSSVPQQHSLSLSFDDSLVSFMNEQNLRKEQTENSNLHTELFEEHRLQEKENLLPEPQIVTIQNEQNQQYQSQTSQPITIQFISTNEQSNSEIVGEDLRSLLRKWTIEHLYPACIR